MTQFQSSGSSADPVSRTQSGDDVSLQPKLGMEQPKLGVEISRAASAVRDEAIDVADSLSKSVKDAASSATRAVKEQASSFASDVGHELGKTAEEQKQRGVEAIQGFVRAVNTAAAELDQQSPRVAGYVRDAAQKVEDLSTNISSRDVNQLIKSASELARTQPMLFFGGAVAAGFALSRFLKSSAPTPAQPKRDPMPGGPRAGDMASPLGRSPMATPSSSTPRSWSGS